MRSDVVHDGADVVDTLLKRGRSRYSVRQSLASLVEGHDAGKRRETAQKPGISGELVQKLDMRDDPGHQDDVDRSVAHHLKGDVDVAAQRVTRIGQFKVAHGSALLRKRAELRSGSEVKSAKNTDLCRSRLGAIASGGDAKRDTQSLRLRPTIFASVPWQRPARVETRRLVAVRYGYQVSDFDH